ncbi:MULTISPECIES: GNAT family N-acetyltransferase [Pantoea]|uniref:GCN5 family acetyltransferase n=1 Tax=Pantoea brenneri TaxID=472694 RepID=A0A653TDT3_9GAMM|nr:MULTISPECIES: GNAT family N-acetyltransferase [Pantoea]KKD32732.1 GCN5 family acetyltransferase [Pantoea sp. 3.5.1]MBS6033042.1 GNAT family N-acetyltransferase [Pantoea sp.]MBZ6395036.1 GNAT family N-acetyltransferase [Pantoea sp.]MBZ6437975.1 GNAT family N-acetyltransferase [Pantoea sp.]MCQ5472351.1 GNAT family N-acetyltransferase [Pantoea brenneri]
MEIRPFTEADRPFLRTLFLAARRHNWRWLDGSDWQLEDFDGVILGETVLVADCDGQRVGFAGLLENDNFLHSLYVDPDWQGRGAGSALLEAVQARFTSTGALKCLTMNKAAQAFYLKHGWKMIAQGEGEQGGYVLMHYPLASEYTSGSGRA